MVTRKVRVRNKSYTVSESKRKNKQLVASDSKGNKVHFGDPAMPEFPGTKRGDRFCTRTSTQKGKNNPKMASFWSRKYLWNCVGKQSKKTKKEAGIELIS